MRHRFHRWVLLFALLWQAIGVAGHLQNSRAPQLWLHAESHVDQPDHHHHDDGSIHPEDSGASHHQHPGHDTHSAVLTRVEWLGPGVAASRAGRAAAPAAYIGPTLEGLLRPPRRA